MHIKRIRIPVYWRGGRKTFYWATTPKPGRHKKFHCIPMQSLLRDVIGVAGTAREVKTILKTKQVELDGEVCTDHQIGVGLLDVVGLGGKFYRIVPFKLGLKPIEIPATDADKKLLRIVKKVSVKGKKTSLTTHDGRTFVVADGKPYSIGDSLVYSFKERKATGHIKLAADSLALIFDGTHRGEIAKVVGLQHNVNGPDTVILEGPKDNFETLKEYVMPVGTEKAVVKVEA